MMRSATWTISAMLIAVVLLMSTAAAKRHRSSRTRNYEDLAEDDKLGPAWQARRNDRIGGTDLLDWSRDPRRVDPKIYDWPGPWCGSRAPRTWAYSLTGQLEGQEWPAGLVKGEQVEPKSKAQLASCQGHAEKRDLPTGHVIEYLGKNDIMLERDMPEPVCDEQHKCIDRFPNCTTYKLANVGDVETLGWGGFPINGHRWSPRVEQLLRDYGPMAFHTSNEIAWPAYNWPWVSAIKCKHPIEDLIPDFNFAGDLASLLVKPGDSVLLVGYGRLDDGGSYFIVKGSKGSGWGNNGYAYMKYHPEKEPSYRGRRWGNEPRCTTSWAFYGAINVWKIKACS